MKKILCLLMACCTIALCACQKNNSVSEKSNSDSTVSQAQKNNSESAEVTTNSTVSPAQVSDMPKPFGDLKSDTGGDENMDYYDTCGFKFNSLSMSFESLVDKNDYEKWRGQTNCVDNDNTNIREVFGLYSFITYFKIPDKTVRDILIKEREVYISQGLENEYYFTDKEIDLLLSKDDKAVAKYFVSENAIEKDGKIYSPKWIYTHSIKDYKNEGLSAELINEKVNKFVDKIQFTAEAKKALKDKVKAYSDNKANN